jgi:sugar/nucleoside kinase (ribokinase family)/nucleoside 2-deoxyribosyltransferase
MATANAAPPLDVVVVGGVFLERIVRENGFDEYLGGSGLTAAVASARLGARTGLVSFVGSNQETGLRRLLERAGVADHVARCAGSSGVFEIADLRDERRPRPMYRPPDAIPSTDQISGPAAPRVVLAFGIPGFNPLPWLEHTSCSGTRLLWDQQGWLSHRVEPSTLARLPSVERLCLANLNELRSEAGTSTHAEAIERKPPVGFDAAVVKCGRWGTIIRRPDDVGTIPAFHADVVSAIGSGDCFAGALAASLAAGLDLDEAAVRASATAALFVGRSSNLLPLGATEAIAQMLANAPRTFVDPRRLERTRAYVAGPFFTAPERLWLSHLEAALDEMGLDVVSPRREIGILPPDADEVQAEHTGERDFAAIDDSHLVIATIDGLDAGTLIEVGYAASKELPVFILDTRTRVPLEPMTLAAATQVARDDRELIDQLTAWCRENLT